MPFSFTPDRVFDCYREITPEYLKSRGVKLLLSDLDFTLAPKSVPPPNEELRKWIGELKDDRLQQPLR